MLISTKLRARNKILKTKISLAKQLSRGAESEGRATAGLWTRTIKPVRFHLLKHVIQLILPSLLNNSLNESILLVNKHFYIPLTSVWAKLIFLLALMFFGARREGGWVRRQVQRNHWRAPGVDGPTCARGGCPGEGSSQAQQMNSPRE